MFQDIYSASNDSMFDFPCTGSALIVFAVFSCVVLLLCYDKSTRRPYEKFAKTLNGPPDYPIVGSLLNFVESPEGNEKNI